MSDPGSNQSMVSWTACHILVVWEILDLLDMQVVEVMEWYLGWFGKLDSKPVKMWDENGSCFQLAGDCPSTSKRCSQGHCLLPGLWSLHSQAEKLLRLGLIVVGPNWLNMTLHTGLVGWPCVDLIPLDIPQVHGIADYHCNEYLHTNSFTYEHQ